MEIRNVQVVSFSPCGGVGRVLESLTRELELPLHFHDLTLPQNRLIPLAFDASDLVFFGFPVYGGLPPQNAAQVMEVIVGQDTPAVLVAVYGNRAYEGALLRLEELAKARGFKPVAAVAAIAEHSLDPEIASQRPDQQDNVLLAEFGLKAFSLAQHGASSFKAPGAYADHPPLPADLLLPGVDLEKCLRCGHCAQVCCNGAIPEDEPVATEAAKCIYCGACVKYCPEKARALRSPQAGAILARLRQAAVQRKEPEFFL